MVMPAEAIFPDPVFGWTFCAVLVAITAVAAYVDLRTWTIPKPITLGALGAGIVFNVIRGALLGSGGEEAWQLGESGVLVGALDGLLFALAGFGVSFGVLVLAFIFGVANGGDVKLMAAVGAWTGPYYFFFVLFGTVVFMVLINAVVLLYSFLTQGASGTARDYSAKKAPRKKGKGQGYMETPTPRRRLIAYSLPTALSVMALLVLYRSELQLAPVPDAENRTGAGDR